MVYEIYVLFLLVRALMSALIACSASMFFSVSIRYGRFRYTALNVISVGNSGTFFSDAFMYDTVIQRYISPSVVASVCYCSMRRRP